MLLIGSPGNLREGGKLYFALLFFFSLVNIWVLAPPVVCESGKQSKQDGCSEVGLSWCRAGFFVYQHFSLLFWLNTKCWLPWWSVRAENKRSSEVGLSWCRAGLLNDRRLVVSATLTGASTHATLSTKKLARLLISSPIQPPLGRPPSRVIWLTSSYLLRWLHPRQYPEQCVLVWLILLVVFCTCCLLVIFHKSVF